MLIFLQWIGQQARFVLLAGCILALFVPSLSAALRPALPFLVALVLGMAAARVDLRAAISECLRSAGLWRLGWLTLAMMPLTALLLWALPLGRFTTSAVLYALAPPIASSATLCLLLGLNARRALEVTIFATLFTPLIGALMIPLLLPDVPVPNAFLLMGKLAAMIIGGLAMGAGLRHIMGPARIEAHKLAFDGVAALIMILFVVPLFDGVPAVIQEQPWLALQMLVLACCLNFGGNWLVSTTLAPSIGRENSGALGLMWGNRTVALYLAALPADPLFGLFVALYQFPMYATPLVFSPRKTRGEGG